MTSSDPQPTPPAGLVVFGAAWCEDTRRTRRHLRRLGVSHHYRDVDEDLDALEQATQLNQGVRRTPVVRVRDAVLVEPSNWTLTAALVEHELLTPDLVAERLQVQNVGDLERCLRVSAGLLLMATKRQAPPVLRGLMALGGAGLLLTGVAGWCPIFFTRRVSSLNGPGDRPDEAERTAWLASAATDALEPRPETEGDGP